MYLGDVFVKMERRRKNKKSVRGEVQKMMEVDAIRKTTNVQRSNDQQHFNLQWVQYLVSSNNNIVLEVSPTHLQVLS